MDKMNNLTSKLFGIGLLNIVLATGMSGCASLEEQQYQQGLKERHKREPTLYQDGISARIGLWLVDDDETNSVYSVLEK